MKTVEIEVKVGDRKMSLAKDMPATAEEWNASTPEGHQLALLELGWVTSHQRKLRALMGTKKVKNDEGKESVVVKHPDPAVIEQFAQFVAPGPVKLTADEELAKSILEGLPKMANDLLVGVLDPLREEINNRVQGDPSLKDLFFPPKENTGLPGADKPA